MSVFISWMETVQPKGPTLYTQQVIVQLAIEMITQLQFCQSHSIKIYVKLRMCPWQMGGPHSVVLCCSEKWLCLLPLYLLPPLLKHLLHQPPALPPLFSEVEKILVMFFFAYCCCGLRLFEGQRQSATNIIQSPSSSPESTVAKAKTKYEPHAGIPRSWTK